MSASSSSAPRYQRLDGVEHVLKRPDTYVGSVAPAPASQWVLRDDGGELERREVTASPALLKIVDEILVNAADNKQRDATMTEIKIDIDREKNRLSVYNNGKGIPIVIHKEHNIYVPELIFGHLLTGSNFDDDEKKTTGGRNGYGAKLANIFSYEFIVETADSASGQKFKQVFEANMTVRKDPKITSVIQIW